jgi:hypothetical protein
MWRDILTDIWNIENQPIIAYIKWLEYRQLIIVILSEDQEEAKGTVQKQ